MSLPFTLHPWLVFSPLFPSRLVRGAFGGKHDRAPAASRVGQYLEWESETRERDKRREREK